MENRELKPCPFCGGEAKLQQDIRYPRPSRRKRRAYEVFCTNPECFLYHVDENYFLNKNEAIEAWNRRVENEQLLNELRSAPLNNTEWEILYKGLLPKYKMLTEVNERLQDEIDNGVEVCHDCHTKYADKIEQAKADTVKKIQERLKAIAYYRVDATVKDRVFVVCVDDIDQIVEEAIGEGNDRSGQSTN